MGVPLQTASLALAGALGIVGCGSTAPGQSTTSVTGVTRAAPSTTTPSTTGQSVAPPPPAPTNAVTTAPPTAPPTTTTSVGALGVALPISVQSDRDMLADGNDGPSSSILAPSSCIERAGLVTAAGGYTNGGLAPEVYDRYGDVVELYVFTAPTPGEPVGTQIADLGAEHPPGIGGYQPWTVAAPLTSGLGAPARCEVAAQPTHDEQLAP